MWAAHQVVEVHPNLEDGSLQFVRIRRDRQKGNSSSEIREILSLQDRPVGLSELKSLPMKFCSFRAPRKHTSKFERLRFLHRDVKGILYRSFGGRSVVDACCGQIMDLRHLAQSGVKTVFAVDNSIRGETAFKTCLKRRNRYRSN